MASKKHGTAPLNWNKHFSKWMKRKFWKANRAAAKKEIKS